MALTLVLATPGLASGEGLRLGGTLSTAIQLRVVGCGAPGQCQFQNFRNANVLTLDVDAQPSAQTELVGRISVRNINFSRIETLDDTGDIANVQPVDIRLGETRLSMFDLFGAAGLDLAMGALDIRWGTGDGVSPTDIVMPYDLEDGSRFDKRLANLAVQVAYSTGGLRVEAVFLPLFMPAILPVDHIDFTALGDPQAVLSLTKDDTNPTRVEQVETPTRTPEFSAENLQIGGRVAYQSGIGDFSVVFFRGFESLPQASGAVRLTGFQTQKRVDLGVPLVYPRILMAGLDYRGPLVDTLSMWVDVAVLFPERHLLSANRNQLEQLVKLGQIDAVPDPIPSQVTQSDEVYVKAVVGLEYVAFEHLYLNLQYARGTPTERQASDIHDYLLLVARLTLLDGRLQLGAQGALEIADVDGTLGYQAGGSISWLHGDAARLTLSTTFQGGDDGTTFSRFHNLSNVRLAASMGF